MQNKPKVPTHAGIDTWKTLDQKDDLVRGLKEFMALTNPPTVTTTKETLFSRYLNNDWKRLIVDLQGRPDHYTPHQKELIRAAEAGTPLTVTEDVMNELVLTYFRATRAAEEVARRISDHRHPENPKPATFEEQDHGGTIKII